MLRSYSQAGVGGGGEGTRSSGFIEQPSEEESLEEGEEKHACSSF